MSAAHAALPTRVLAVASHVVSGYVGNKVAVFVLQSLGYDVAALNTVQFSNHTGYGQWTGSKVSAGEMADLYAGLRRCLLDDFDMMLSGYVPGAEAVVAVGDMAKELKARDREAEAREAEAGGPTAGETTARGRFFWVLDPVMGDDGQIYVAEDVVPAYKSLVPHADLILPNQFEAELLSGVVIVDTDSLAAAVQALHDQYGVPHVVITSVRLAAPHQPAGRLSVVGSSMTSGRRARLFRIVFPAVDAYFCGTGDMFAALVTARMREAVAAVPGLARRPGWLSADDTPAPALPLASAAERALASMHDVLARTRDAMPAVVGRTTAAMAEADRADDRKAQCVKSKAAELQLVQNLDCLRAPTKQFKAELV